MPTLKTLATEIIACRKCTRLVDWMAEVKIKKKREFADCDYWCRPLPGFGDNKARMVLVGLAPAAHGGTRAGRMFTGDSSSAFLSRALFTAGFANQPRSVAVDDGLRLSDAYMVCAGRCAPPQNKPTRDELENCRPFLLRELQLLTRMRVIVGLGKIGFDAIVRALPELGVTVPGPRPKFGHGAKVVLNRKHGDGLVLLASYHPSRQNTNTGRLTEAMFDDVFAAAREALARP